MLSLGFLDPVLLLPRRSPCDHILSSEVNLMWIVPVLIGAIGLICLAMWIITKSDRKGNDRGDEN
jgi:flagellar biogenesis protein FliO